MGMSKKQRQVTIGLGTFESLWQSKEQFRKITKGKVTWDSFIGQAVLLLESKYLSTEVKAIRYSPYIFGMVCPVCNTQDNMVIKRGTIIWKVTCSKCGNEYIAVA